MKERKKLSASADDMNAHGNPRLQRSVDHHADLAEPWSSELVAVSSDTAAAPGQAQVPEETEQVQAS